MSMMHRLVHLDLKGAPLKVDYLEKVLLCIKKWGASGILLEWEDTFPYMGELACIGSERDCSGDGMYSLMEVKHILRFSKDVGLEPIQLIQTIGHMEFVLKHPAFRGLREAAKSPAVLCPSAQESMMLVQAMLMQALTVQPDAKYLHIGADEVWHTGVCDVCQRRAYTNEHKSACLFLDHVRSVASFVRQNFAVTVLMWDDMLRTINMDTLTAYQLGELVEPVLWLYNPIECFQIDPNLWQLYRQLFPRLWAGSAFKGANGSCQIVSPVSRYVSNHEAWIKEINKYQTSINFGGIILTGWSRFDHYATLCELMPASLPSLASCLKLLVNTGKVDESVVNDVLPSEQWPGEHLARCLHSLVGARDRSLAFLNGDLITTWLNPWQLENNYTNPLQIEAIGVTSHRLQSEVISLQTELTPHLLSITGKRSADEWVQTFIAPLLRRLREVQGTVVERTLRDAGVKPSKD